MRLKAITFLSLKDFWLQGRGNKHPPRHCKPPGLHPARHIQYLGRSETSDCTHSDASVAAARAALARVVETHNAALTPSQLRCAIDPQLHHAAVTALAGALENI